MCTYLSSSVYWMDLGQAVLSLPPKRTLAPGKVPASRPGLRWKLTAPISFCDLTSALSASLGLRTTRAPSVMIANRLPFVSKRWAVVYSVPYFPVVLPLNLYWPASYSQFHLVIQPEPRRGSYCTFPGLKFSHLARSRQVCYTKLRLTGPLSGLRERVRSNHGSIAA